VPPLSESLPLLLLLIGLFVVAVFLAAAEASLLRVSGARARARAAEGDAPSARVAALIDDLPRVLNAVLLVVLLAQVGAATVAGFVAERHFGNLGVTLTSVGLTLVMFVYAEAIPKTLAVRRPLAVARLVSRPVGAMAWVLRPVVALLIRFADLQAPGHGITMPVSVTEAELRHMAAEAAHAGEIEHSDRDLIERAFRVGDAVVAEVIVPRIEMHAVNVTASADEALQEALRHGHRRLPVYRDDLDDVTGAVRLRDLARAVREESGEPVEALQRPVLIVPETKRVIEVLREMQRGGGPVAIVVDEHGGTTGMATVEDIVEELVGDIADAEHPEDPEIRRLADGRWVVKGSTDVDDLEVETGASFEPGDFHTVAGLVLQAAGHIPSPGETFEIGGWAFHVTDATRRRVRRVEMRRREPA
jgi:putative hemolysin